LTQDGVSSVLTPCCYERKDFPSFLPTASPTFFEGLRRKSLYPFPLDFLAFVFPGLLFCPLSRLPQVSGSLFCDFLYAQPRQIGRLPHMTPSAHLRPFSQLSVFLFLPTFLALPLHRSYALRLVVFHGPATFCPGLSTWFSRGTCIWTLEGVVPLSSAREVQGTGR